MVTATQTVKQSVRAAQTTTDWKKQMSAGHMWTESLHLTPVLITKDCVESLVSRC